MTPIIFVGEAWGEQEAKYESPFVGPSGQELYRMLADAGYPCGHLSYSFVSPYRMTKLWGAFPHPLLNVFSARPPDPENKNRVEYLYARISDNIPIDRTLPRRRMGAAYYYVRAEYADHVRQLHAQLQQLKPNVIVALGATACWALGLPESIGKIRGSLHETPFGKVIPCYHPASILRNWSNRTITVLDLFKARRESASPNSDRVSREIWCEPSITDLYTWWKLYGADAEMIAFDIETVRKQQISEVGFAASATRALHIPFIVEQGKSYKSYWPDAKTELQAWQFVREVLTSPIPKIAQNGKYDAYWLVKELRIPIRNWAHDTMQKSHCWQPEFPKSLQFLGSVFLDERDWKSIRRNVGKEE